MTSPAPAASRRRRTVVVTGGTRRLGRIVSEALAADGWDILATYSAARTGAAGELDSFSRELETKHGVSCVCHPVDLADPQADDIERTLDRCPSPLSGLVNNAAVFEWDSLATLDRSAIEATLTVNLVAPLLVTSAVARRLAGADGIVAFILDQKIFNPYPDHFTYTVSKGAAHMALTLCARTPDTTVRYYGLAPGLTLPAPGQSETSFRAAQKTVPLARSPSPREIGGAIRFLFRGTAANGFVLTLDGGASLVQRSRDFEFHS